METVGAIEVLLPGVLDQARSSLTAYRNDMTTLEAGLDNTPVTGWKSKRFLRTFCHGQSILDVSLSN